MKKKNKAKRNGKGRKKWNHEESFLAYMYSISYKWDEHRKETYLYATGKDSDIPF